MMEPPLSAVMVMMLSAMEKNENIAEGKKDKTEGKKMLFKTYHKLSKNNFWRGLILDGRSDSSGHLRLATPIRPTNT